MFDWCEQLRNGIRFTWNGNSNYTTTDNNRGDNMEKARKTKEMNQLIAQMPSKKLEDLTPEQLRDVKFYVQHIKDNWAGNEYYKVIGIYKDNMFHRVFDELFGEMDNSLPRVASNQMTEAYIRRKQAMVGV